jgi:hypothetical protein
VVAGGDHHRHPLAEEGDDLEVALTDRRRAQDAEVEVAVEHPAHHLGRGALPEGEAHPGVAVEEAGEPLRQPPRPHRVEEAEAYLAALGGDRSLGVGDGLSEVVEEPLRPGHQAVAGGGQADAPAYPLEEGDPHLLLQPRDLPRHRRLLGAQGLRGMAEVAVLGDREEGPEPVHIDAIHASIRTEL